MGRNAVETVTVSNYTRKDKLTQLLIQKKHTLDIEGMLDYYLIILEGERKGLDTPEWRYKKKKKKSSVQHGHRISR